MRLVIVGPVNVRDALRRALAGAPIDIVDEALTLAAARERHPDADAFVVAGHQRAGAGQEDRLAEPLTKRELDVLELLAEGLPNKAIASRLEISDQTVKFHVASICGKLGAANRTEAVRLAIRHGIVTI